MFQIKLNDSLELRQFQSHDAPELFALIENHRDYLCYWLSRQTLCTTLEDTVNLIRSGSIINRENGAFEAGLWIAGDLAGAVGLHLIDWKKGQSDIGYWLVPTFQGKGFMTMAVGAVIDYAFAQYKLKRLSIRCPIHNNKSRAIPERLGFNLAEIKLGYTSRAPTGQTVDYASYLISPHQWYERPPPFSRHLMPKAPPERYL